MVDQSNILFIYNNIMIKIPGYKEGVPRKYMPISLGVSEIND